MRSYGTKTKVSPNQVKIGSTESGLYYDKSFPFLEKYTQMGGYGKEIVKYRLRKQEKKPSDMLNVQSWDPIKKKLVTQKVRRDDPRVSFYSSDEGYKYGTLSQEFGGQTKAEKIVKPLIEKIFNNPQEYGALKGSGQLSTPKVWELVNAKLVDEGLKPYAGITPIHRILKEVRGKVKSDSIIGTQKEKDIVNFLKKDDLYKTITSKDAAKHFPGVPHYIIARIRKAKELSSQREQLGSGYSKFFKER